MAGIPNSQAVIRERREKLFSLLVRGMKPNEIAKALKVNNSTVTRDIQYLTAQSQNYLNDLGKQTVPFMYQNSIEGIREVLKECWNIYTADPTTEGNEGITWGHKLVALKLAKECNEGMFKLFYEAPTVIYVNSLHDKLEALQKGIYQSKEQLKEVKYTPNIESSTYGFYVQRWKTVLAGSII
jgi:hypothetical protein